MGVVQRHARPAIVIAAALFVVACTSPAQPGDGSEGSDPSDTSTAASSASTAPSETGEAGETGETGYAEHTVEPPGAFDGVQYGDDMLLVDDEPIPEDVIERIGRISIAGEKAVAAAESFSVGQISIEGKSYRIAAVDPGDYRRFAGPKSAPFDDQWDRIAGGEIAVLESMRARLPLDDNGFLAVGSGEQTFPIHVGAYSPSQVGTVDAVVNTEWGEALGLVEDNALVINTGLVSPQAVKEKLTKIVGNISITDLDVVAQYGLDPNTFQSVQYVGTFADAVGVYRYTPIGGGRVQPEAAWVREHIVTDTVPLLGTVTCNKAMMEQLKAALSEIVSLKLGEEVYQTAGCYYPRFIAGTTTLSNHSFGLAIDINSLENQRGTVGQMHPTVVAIFEKWGFAWGGRWSYTDPMHFELERIVTPG